MPTPAKGPRMGGSPAHERLMLANLATALFEHGRITTTEAKAKRLRPYAEKLVTFGKRGDLHARRQVLKVLRDKSVVHELFAEIGPRYANRPGGYTRIVKIGNRKGDNAPMAIIELVEALTVAQTAVGEAERARGTRAAPRRAASPATRESAAELADQSSVAAAVAAQPETDVVPVDVAAAAQPDVAPVDDADGAQPETDVPPVDAAVASQPETDVVPFDAADGGQPETDVASVDAADGDAAQAPEPTDGSDPVVADDVPMPDASEATGFPPAEVGDQPADGEPGDRA